jgi:predicted secreted protein
MLEQNTSAVKIAGIDQLLDTTTKVNSVTISDAGWSIAYSIYHQGDGKKLIREGFTEIRSDSPEYAALTKINAGIDAAFKTMLPSMLAKLNPAPPAPAT